MNHQNVVFYSSPFKTHVNRNSFQALSQHCMQAIKTKHSVYVCLSVCMHKTTREWLNQFLLNFILEDFTQSGTDNSYGQLK
jgi:hypothetical protein